MGREMAFQTKGMTTIFLLCNDYLSKWYVLTKNISKIECESSDFLSSEEAFVFAIFFNDRGIADCDPFMLICN